MLHHYPAVAKVQLTISCLDDVLEKRWLQNYPSLLIYYIVFIFPASCFICWTMDNTWTIKREIGENGTLLDFIISISRCVISATSDRNDKNQEPTQKWRSEIRANQVPDDIHYDEKNHWPLQIDGTTQTCKHSGCSRRSRFICSKCQIALCVVGSKCFLESHGQMWACFLILETLDTKSHNTYKVGIIIIHIIHII